ncbi:hypothetical protein OS493_034707 [Desmophyllum pertusum]|uniref:Uncharacterized protein n=1 Tax=Desmophyllum pertusum TaxID=174260 RepID=A0A9W9Z7Q6_9CNID|nr:hypothetical protein OS493_034707 [Desmophyllum pertusum]
MRVERIVSVRLSPRQPIFCFMLDVMSAPRQRLNLHQVPTTGLGGCRSFHTNLCSAHAMNSQEKRTLELVDLQATRALPCHKSTNTTQPINGAAERTC